MQNPQRWEQGLRARPDSHGRLQTWRDLASDWAGTASRSPTVQLGRPLPWPHPRLFAMTEHVPDALLASEVIGNFTLNKGTNIEHFGSHDRHDKRLGLQVNGFESLLEDDVACVGKKNEQSCKTFKRLAPTLLDRLCWLHTPSDCVRPWFRTSIFQASNVYWCGKFAVQGGRVVFSLNWVKQ